MAVWQSNVMPVKSNNKNKVCFCVSFFVFLIIPFYGILQKKMAVSGILIIKSKMGLLPQIILETLP